MGQTTSFKLFLTHLDLSLLVCSNLITCHSAFQPVQYKKDVHMLKHIWKQNLLFWVNSGLAYQTVCTIMQTCNMFVIMHTGPETFVV